jgi:hypothetical protein
MKIRQVLEKTTLILALALFPCYVSAQRFQVVSQEGVANAVATVSGPVGGDSDNDQKSSSNTSSIDIFAGAGASLSEMFASATAHLVTSIAPQMLTLAGTLDGNGSTTFPEMQTAGGAGGINLTLVFRVDAPVLLTLIGETSGVWNGDAGVDAGIALYSTSAYLTDIIGPGGRVEFQGVLVPEETYTLSAYGNASAVTSELNAFSSAQGGFTASLSLQAAPVPEPGCVALLLSLSSLGVCLLARRSKSRQIRHRWQKSKPVLPLRMEWDRLEK